MSNSIDFILIVILYSGMVWTPQLVFYWWAQERVETGKSTVGHAYRYMYYPLLLALLFLGWLPFLLGGFPGILWTVAPTLVCSILLRNTKPKHVIPDEWQRRWLDK